MKNNQISLTRRNKTTLPTILLGIACGLCVVVARLPLIQTAIPLFGIVFSYSDIFIMIAAGIGGLGSGMLAFTLLFIAEFFHIEGDASGLYSLSTYLVVTLVTAKLAYDRMFADLWRTIRSTAILSLLLALCWLVTFTVLTPTFNANMDGNVYQNISFGRLFLSAAPECVISCAAIRLFFRFASEKAKFSLGSGWLYTGMYEERKKAGGIKRRYVLGFRVTALSVGEAILLCIVAILSSDIQFSITMGEKFTISLIAQFWRQNLQLALTMICASLPIAYVFNMFILSRVIAPINEMSFLMEQYFDCDGNKRFASRKWWRMPEPILTES